MLISTFLSYRGFRCFRRLGTVRTSLRTAEVEIPDDSWFCLYVFRQEGNRDQLKPGTFWFFCDISATKRGGRRL